MDTSYNNGCLDQVVIGVMDIHTRFKNLKAANGWHSKQPLLSHIVLNSQLTSLVKES